MDADNFKGPEGEGLQLFPETHGQAGYALFLNNPNFKGNGFLQVDFEALRWKPWTIFFYTGMNYNTGHAGFQTGKGKLLDPIRTYLRAGTSTLLRASW